MHRDDMLRRLRERGAPWDLVVVGGGATGVGVAVDAASRGHAVALFEAHDFGKGTSSRSTKLVHGGVRYLQQGNIPLVIEALKERGILRRNAPHLVSELPFVVPNYRWWEAPFYGVGMRVYDVLAGKYDFGPSRNLSVEETVERLPTIETEGLRGGVLYHDGQFDDARLLVHLAMTAAEQGAVLVNYARVEGFHRDPQGFLSGVRVRDVEGGGWLDVPARVVVNATGVFTDELRRADDPDAPPLVRPSQGVHVVLPRAFLPGDAAIMVPQTDDGRVLFAIPWHERVLVGTTDTPVQEASLEPRALQHEVDFLLEHAARYMTRDPGPQDVLSVFAGLRPLVTDEPAGAETATISREHALRIAESGLLTVAGGKWTTYRKMAEDVVDAAQALGDLDPRDCITRELNVHGYHSHADRFGPLALYGSDAPRIREIAEDEEGMDAPVHERLDLTRAEVAWAARHEMARTVDDVLARRHRALLLDARAALESARPVAEVLAAELGRDEAWIQAQVQEFEALARGYLIS